MVKHGGKRSGAGRPRKAVEEEQLTFIRRCLPADKREALINRMYEIALGDNLKAAVSAGSLLLAYSLGKPAEKHEHSGKNGEPITLNVIYVSKPTNNQAPAAT